MKWFKFLIYFSLFAGAILNAATGASLLTGSIYEMRGGVDPDAVYAILPDMKTVDMAYGVFAILIAVMGIVTRFMLSGFSKNGPKMYLAMLILSIVASLIYSIAADSILSEFYKDIGSTNDVSLLSENLPSAFTSFAMLVCNITYFKKRQHLFVN